MHMWPFLYWTCCQEGQPWKVSQHKQTVLASQHSLIDMQLHSNRVTDLIG